MKGVTWFLVICFGLAWVSWELAIRAGVGVTSWQFEVIALPGAFAPAIAAIVVRRWITREGFTDAGLRLHANRWPYYLFAWLLPLLVVALIVAEAGAFGIATPDFTLTRAAGAGAAGHSVNAVSREGWLIVPELMAVAVVMTPVLWGEEFGWRGYLQRRLLPGRPVAAALVTGLIWGVWHYPVTLRGYDYPDHPIAGSLLLTALAILLAYIFEWLREKSGSIWAPSLAHAATNSIGGLALLWLGPASPAVVGYGGILALPPLTLVCVCIYWSERRRQHGKLGVRSSWPTHRTSLPSSKEEYQ
jgi:membrane protease YdiL (CAAX protease family)